RDAVLHGVLVLGEALHRHVEIARHESLQAVAIETDQAAQELDGKQVLPLGFLFEDDLGQHRTGDVLASARIADFELGALFDHLRQMVERHVARCLRVVEPPVGVLLDNYRTFALLIFCHSPPWFDASRGRTGRYPRALAHTGPWGLSRAF